MITFANSRDKTLGVEVLCPLFLLHPFLSTTAVAQKYKECDSDSVHLGKVLLPKREVTYPILIPL